MAEQNVIKFPPDAALGDLWECENCQSPAFNIRRRRHSGLFLFCAECGDIITNARITIRGE